MDSVESDYGNYLNDAMEDSYTEFVVEDNEDKHKDQDKEDNLLDTPYYNQPRAIVPNLIPLTASIFKATAHPKKRKTAKKKLI